MEPLYAICTELPQNRRDRPRIFRIGPGTAAGSKSFTMINKGKMVL